jgi:RNA recognition motif-containing protein
MPNPNSLHPKYKNYSRQKCFVAHSHDAQWREDLISACDDILPQFDLEPWYAAEQVDPTQILLDKVVELIANSRYGIYDLSYWWHKDDKTWKMPCNVFIELGIAIALNCPTLLLSKQHEQKLELPECLKSVREQILPFTGEISLKRILQEHIPEWIKQPPEKNWWNPYCIFGNQICPFREVHPKQKQILDKKLSCLILDSPNKDRQDFRDLTKEVLDSYSNITHTYFDDLSLIEGYQFLLCTHCQTIRSSSFAIYRITPNTPPEVFIAIGITIALEKKFEYKIPKIIITEELKNIPSLLSGYEVILAENDRHIKKKLRQFIPAVLKKIRETTWQPRPLPFIDHENLLDEENEPEKQLENETNKFKIEQTVYISNLSHTVTEEDLNEVFVEYGKVEQIHLPVDPQTNHNRGFAFIAMSTKEETAAAAESLDGAEWVGLKLTVRIATANEVTNLEPEFGQRFGLEKFRIYDLSKEFNLENREILEICDQLNIPYKSHSSTITRYEAERIKVRAEIYKAQKYSSKDSPSVLVAPPRPLVKPANIYIGNLPYKVTQEDLNQLFSDYGSVREITIPEDIQTGHSRGFGFVKMATKTEAETAIAALNGAEWMGRTLKVAQAKPRR